MDLMHNKSIVKLFLIFLFTVTLIGCEDKGLTPPDFDNQQPEESDDTFYFGADLSHVNQILDHAGVYKDAGEVMDPYKIFADHGTNLVRLRLWHTPAWTKEVYSPEGGQMYNDIKDVETAMVKAKALDMKVLLDIHYSDTWADPGNQEIPEAWQGITSIDVLADSVYEYTLNTLNYLDSKGLMPEMVQVGNETNCGMLYTDAPASFPDAYSCDNEWANPGMVMNAAIDGIHDASTDSSVEPKILIHVADPVNITSFTSNLINKAKVTDFDIIGFSYYPLWHTAIPFDQLDETVSAAKDRFGKDLMILETAYPWTTDWDDDYNNSFGSGDTPLPDYPFTPEGQYAFLKALTQKMMDGGGIGIVYWEPAWITSEMKDMWGTGSSWENATLFDFEGNPLQGMEYAHNDYALGE